MDRHPAPADAPAPAIAGTAVLGRIASAALYPRPVWRSERAYIITAIAGVIGLGNIWRFPYMAGANGGGAFVLAYVVCVLLIAIPLATLESAAGSLARTSPVGLFRRAAGGRRWGPAFGWALIALTTAILSYYFVITGWTLGFAVEAARGRIVTFDAFTAGYASLGWFAAVGAAVLWLLRRDVGAVERTSRLLLPVLTLIVIGLAVYAQTLDGAGAGRAFYLGFDRERFTSPVTWQMAAGQAFYSLGVGQGVLIAYGSYSPAGVNLVKSTTAIAIANSTVSLVAGLMVFAIVFAFGIAPDTGSQLAFTAFPRVFAAVPGGHLLAVAFFALLFVAAYTSCVAGAVVVMSAVRDELRLSGRAAARLVVAAIVVLGVPSALSFSGPGLEVAGRPFLERLDQATGSGVMLVAGLGGAALIAHRLPARRLLVAMDADPWRLGPVLVRPAWILAVARWIPVAAAGWLLLSWRIGA